MLGRARRRTNCGTELRRVLDVTVGGLLEREVELVGQGCQPGQNIAEFVELLFGCSLAHCLGEFAHLLAEPGNGRRDPPFAVALPVEVLHEILELCQFHDPDRTGSGGGAVRAQVAMNTCTVNSVR